MCHAQSQAHHTIHIHLYVHPSVLLELQKQVPELGGLVEGRGVGERWAPGHVLARGGAARRVRGQLRDAEHVRAVHVVRRGVAAVSACEEVIHFVVKKLVSTGAQKTGATLPDTYLFRGQS